jgi:CubicO group peptidase (beta-lactamase class C family)
VSDQVELQTALERLVAQHRVPGAVVAVWRDGTLTTAAAGVANLNTGAAMAADTGFLTGSITKVWMTTLIMTFVEDGLIDLDAPIVTYAPEVRFGADEKVARSLTVRNLLNHSSGVDTGDYFVNSREYPDGVEDYLPPIAEAGKLTEPGTVSSYNNIGWIVAEVILRRLTGRNFHELLRERVIEPLGLRRTVLSAQEAILHRTAVGGYPDGEGGHRATPQFSYPTAWAAPGTTLITTVEDTIAFLRTHLAGGVTPDGHRLLSEESVTTMRRPTSPSPEGADRGFALGWRYLERDGRRVLSHAGGSLGGIAHAVLSPADDLAAIAFVNSGAGMAAHADIVDLVFPGGPSPLAPPAADIREGVDLAPFAGRYRRKSQQVDVRVDGDELVVTTSPIAEDLVGATVYLTGRETGFRAAPTGPHSLVSRGAAHPADTVTMTFSEHVPGSGYQLLFMAGRLARRTADTA